MKHLLVLLYAILMISPAVSDEVTGEVPFEETQPLYKWVCEALDENICGDYSPVVLYAELDRGYLGLHYVGARFVLLSNRFQGQPWSVFRNAVIVHEMVHFILSEDDRWQGDTDYCKNENAAWAAFNLYAKDRGRPDIVVKGWSSRYPECDGKTYIGG